MKTIQRLNDYDALRRFNIETGRDITLPTLSSLNKWQLLGGSFKVVGENYFAGSHYVMEMSPNSTGPLTLYLEVENTFTEEDSSEIFVFTGVFFSSLQNITVDCKLYGDLTPSTGNARTLQAGVWGAGRSNSFTLPEINEFSSEKYFIEITITNHSQQTVKLSTPNLINDTAWTGNPVLANIKRHMPDFYFEYDAREVDPIFPMSRYVDVMTDTIADTMLLYSEWFQYDAREIPQGYSSADPFTKSRLTNHTAVRQENREWLAQFSGTNTRNQIYYNRVNLFYNSSFNDETVGWGSADFLSISEISYDGDSACRVYFDVLVSESGLSQSVSAKQNVKYTASAYVMHPVEETTPLSVSVKIYFLDESFLEISSSSSEYYSLTDEWQRISHTALSPDGTKFMKVVFSCPIDSVGPNSFIIDACLAEQSPELFDFIETTEAKPVIPESQLSTFLEWQLSPAGYGIGSGTQSAIKEAAKFLLTGSKSIVLSQRGNGNPWTIKIITLIDESPSSDAILAATELARPLGFTIVHETTEKFTLTLGDSVYGVLGTAVL